MLPLLTPPGTNPADWPLKLRVLDLVISSLLITLSLPVIFVGLKHMRLSHAILGFCSGLNILYFLYYEILYLTEPLVEVTLPLSIGLAFTTSFLSYRHENLAKTFISTTSPPLIKPRPLLGYEVHRNLRLRPLIPPIPAGRRGKSFPPLNIYQDRIIHHNQTLNPKLRKR